MSENTIPPDGTEVRVLSHSMVGVPGGTKAIVRHKSPGGFDNRPRLVWLELDHYIEWSHGRSELPGYWATPAEFETPSEPTP